MKPFKLFLVISGALTAILLYSGMQAQSPVGFPGPELLSRPTDTSVTVNVVADAAIDAYFEYGTRPGVYSGKTDTVSVTANEPLLTLLSSLKPDTPYHYRMVYRRSGANTWTPREAHTFHTQRPAGSTFTFTVASDSHISITPFGNAALYQAMLQSLGRDNPDFHLDLGDTFSMDTVRTQEQANTNYLAARAFFGLISPSIPVFIVLGNHEQEEGWHLAESNNLAETQPVLSVNARKRYYPNPNPLLSSFYTGNTNKTSRGTQAISGDHLLEDYYAFQWGDAMFVAIDPYWYSTTKPYISNIGGGEAGAGSGDRWDWTLGEEQYRWLKKTLENSKAKYKFIFCHNMPGGIVDYGWGGANGVPNAEWGGHEADGTFTFDKKRPGWGVPIHQMLQDNHVTAVIHGHDHEFVLEKRDGVIYQTMPMAAESRYSYGFQFYQQNDPFTIQVLPNAGYLRVRVSPSGVTADYVRAYLPGDGTNGEVAYSYSMTGPNPKPLAPKVRSLSLNPGSVGSGKASTVTVTLTSPAPKEGVIVSIESDNPGSIVPSNVKVPANAFTATFTLTVRATASASTATIKARLNGSEASAKLTITPVP